MTKAERIIANGGVTLEEAEAMCRSGEGSTVLAEIARIMCHQSNELLHIIRMKDIEIAHLCEMLKIVDGSKDMTERSYQRLFNLWLDEVNGKGWVTNLDKYPSEQ